MLYRQGIKTFLADKDDVEVIGEADNGVHLLTLLKAVTPDVILLDIRMPLMNGVETLPEVRKMLPAVKVIMVTMETDHSMISKMMELGANSYLTKDGDPGQVYEAIKTVMKDDYFFNDTTNQAMLSSLKQRNAEMAAGPSESRLNEKEKHILKLMCEEKSTKEIADIVDLSPRTVEALRDKLKVKTGAKTVAGLILYAVKHNIIEAS